MPARNGSCNIHVSLSSSCLLAKPWVKGEKSPSGFMYGMLVQINPTSTYPYLRPPLEPCYRNVSQHSLFVAGALTAEYCPCSKFCRQSHKASSCTLGVFQMPMVSHPSDFDSQHSHCGSTMVGAAMGRICTARAQAGVAVTGYVAVVGRHTACESNCCFHQAQACRFLQDKQFVLQSIHAVKAAAAFTMHNSGKKGKSVCRCWCGLSNKSCQGQ